MSKVILILFAIGVFLVPVAKADLYTLDLSSSNCCGAGPFGTITVVPGANSNTLDVTVTLTAGDVFAKTGGWEKPVIGFLTSKPVTFSAIASGFSGDTHPPESFPSFGSFQYTIDCDVCGNGTSSPQRSSTTFSVFSPTGLTPAAFIKNSSGYFWAVDIGVPKDHDRYFSDMSTSGHHEDSYDTFNVASNTVIAATPEPSSIFLLLTAAVGCVWGVRKRLSV
jgi:hypothetical protein